VTRGIGWDPLLCGSGVDSENTWDAGQKHGKHLAFPDQIPAGSELQVAATHLDNGLLGHAEQGLLVEQ
jgi:hypothetical protein